MSKSRRRNQIRNAELAATDKQTREPMPAGGAGDTLLLDATEQPIASDVLLLPAQEPLLDSGTRVPTPMPVSPTLRSLSRVITVEVALYIGIAVAAMLFRLANLEARPLAPSEAQTAAAAWEFLNGKPVGPFSSPLLFTLDWLAFFLFGASDLTARFFPALLSSFVVFVPVLARRALGKSGALIAALLIAFSPGMVYFARNLSGVDLAVGGAVAALLLIYKYRESNRSSALYAVAFLTGLSLTADSTAFPILLVGGIYYGIVWTRGRQSSSGNAEPAEEQNLAAALHNPVVRAGILFAATYVLFATTWLLNRDGLGVAFNLLGAWLAGFSSIGNFSSPLNLLIVYEPLPLIFGLAGLVLVFTLRSNEAPDLPVLRLLSILSLALFLTYTVAGDKSPAVLVAIALPMMLLAGWFIGNLLERAVLDIQTTGGWRSALSGEVPILAMLMVLAVLVYLQFVTFLQQTRFSPALDSIYRLLNTDTQEASFLLAAITLLIITVLLLGVFIGLSIMLVGIARTTTLVAFTILILLSLGTLRALWALDLSDAEPLRELAAASQTPSGIRYLVQDIEFNSQWKDGDPHILRIAADSSLGSAGTWYLRDFQNTRWTNDVASMIDAEAVITNAETPPPGNWRGQRYRINVVWDPANFSGLDLWKWFVFRSGGDETWQSTTLWLPTDLQQ